jgi:hypothetical protein
MRVALALLVCAGCNQVFGLDPPSRGDDADADVRDGDSSDAADDGGGGPDASCAVGHDEDIDGIVDACDNCPHVYNQTQNDTDLDGVGEACDPRPTSPGDRIVLFLAFDVMPPQLTFEPANTGQWVVSGDTLRLLTPTGDHLARYPLGLSVVNVQTYFAVDTFVAPTLGQTRSAGVWARISPQANSTPGTPWGLVMETVLEATSMGNHSFIQLTALEVNAPGTSSRLEPPGFTFTVGEKYGTSIGAYSEPIAGQGSTTGIAGGVQIPSTNLGAGDVGLRTHATAASFYYLVVFSRDP